MIAKLKGVIDNIGNDWAIIDVGGVGYLVFCSGRTLGQLTEGGVVEIMIETHVREDHIHLYGFADAVERDWFRLLTTVQGVGVKVALGLLTVLRTEELTQAVAAADKGAITQAPGVGQKLATRILSELKDKIGSITLAAMPGAVSVAEFGPGGGDAGGPLGDAASALVNLGYNPSQALSAASRAAGRLGEDASVESLIRGGLIELAPADVRGSA